MVCPSVGELLPTKKRSEVNLAPLSSFFAAHCELIHNLRQLFLQLHAIAVSSHRRGNGRRVMERFRCRSRVDVERRFRQSDLAGMLRLDQAFPHKVDCLVHGVGLHEQQVARLRHGQRSFDGEDAAAYLLNITNTLTTADAGAEEGGDFARLTAPNVVIFVEDHCVKGLTEEFALLDHILVAPVAGRGIHGNAARRRELIDRVQHAAEGTDVVPIVNDDRRAVVLKQVEPAGAALHVRAERAEAHPDDREIQAGTPASSNRGERVLNLEPNAAAVSQRHMGEGLHVDFAFAFAEDDRVVVDRDRAAALGTMRRKHLVLGVAGEEHDMAGAVFRHLDGERIGGVENAVAGTFGHGFDDRALDASELFERVDIAKAKVIAFADIRDNRDVAAIEPETRAKNPAACRFEHGEIDAGVHQDVLSAGRTAAIASVDASILDVDAIGASHADASARLRDDVGNEPRGGCLAVNAGDGDDRNTAVVAGGEHRVDDRAADIARRAARWLDVHPQARCRVDFDDDGPLLFHWPRDIRCNDIDAGDVETDDAGRFDRAGRDFGVKRFR